MIELIMVMLLVSILGSLALTAFIDFRKEAKIARIKQTLSVIRTGFRTQTQQAMLRCGTQIVNGTLRTRNGSLYWAQLFSVFRFNDITRLGLICSTSEISNTADRKFFDIPSPALAKSFSLGVETSTTVQVPANPFVSNYSTAIIAQIAKSVIDTFGGRCAFVDSLGGNPEFHWLYTSPSDTFSEDADVFPGTNTPGVNECNF